MGAICRSMTTTSGRRPSESIDASSSMASAPPAACPSTSISGSPSRKASRPRRTTSWSSTMRTPIPAPGSWFTSTVLVLLGHPDRDDGATRRGAREGELPADLGRTAAHRVKAEVTGMSGGWIEPAPVVADLDDDLLLVNVHPNLRHSRLGVHQDIGKRLPADGEQLSLHLPGELERLRGPPQVH